MHYSFVATRCHVLPWYEVYTQQLRNTVAQRHRVKRQNVCFSRRVDLSDKMCAFLGVGWVVFGCVVLGLCSSCPAVSDGPGGVEVGVDAGVVDFRPAVG